MTEQNQEITETGNTTSMNQSCQDVLQEANKLLEAGMHLPEQVDEAASSDQQMKVDSEGTDAKEETKNEPVLGQIRRMSQSHQKEQEVKDKFDGGGVHTNEEKTV